MHIVKLFLTGFLFISCTSDVNSCENCSQNKPELSEEELRQLRYEFLKSQILWKLQLKEPPKLRLPKPPLKSLRVIPEIAENDPALQKDEKSDSESIVIYPRDASDHYCVMNETQHCTRFEFVIPESSLLNNFVSAEVWFHIQTNAQYIQVQQIFTGPSEDFQESFDLLSGDNTFGSWKYYKLPRHRFIPSASKELILEVINIKNDTNADIAVGVTGDESPFLIIRSNINNEPPRKKRSITCTSDITSCCKENFYLNFSAVGWDNWILHPDGYDANFCRGHCFNDFSNTRFYHSAVLLSYIQDNKGIAKQIGLNMCCTPSVMGSVSIIYRNDEGQIYFKTMNDMKVEACNCA